MIKLTMENGHEVTFENIEHAAQYFKELEYNSEERRKQRFSNILIKSIYEVIELTDVQKSTSYTAQRLSQVNDNTDKSVCAVLKGIVLFILNFNVNEQIKVSGEIHKIPFPTIKESLFKFGNVYFKNANGTISEDIKPFDITQTDVFTWIKVFVDLVNEKMIEIENPDRDECIDIKVSVNFLKLKFVQDFISDIYPTLTDIPQWKKNLLLRFTGMVGFYQGISENDYKEIIKSFVVKDKVIFK